MMNFELYSIGHFRKLVSSPSCYCVSHDVRTRASLARQFLWRYIAVLTAVRGRALPVELAHSELARHEIGSVGDM
jgi:hypothetical protein